ncbi:hypothetical protein HG536_0A07230 [Torulaspora globosa]|uniref:Uncharacterized protein n=1 Tax=Torulaspora globosa TaxID=48254 RepID=A0A7G3ZBM2_9SACH|nr:uncharacterized protein HG536_0A07230 [Torulaspora globosa]QLL30908.1 hypothetical protein HG536_0A07230 [Torulaspora globosa]
MAGDSNLTREFFEKQEVDDTLQRIREQYLASKKNLQELMKKQNEERPTTKNFSPALKDLDPVGAFRNSSIGVRDGAPAARGPTADDLVLLNEVRSLKRLTIEQQQLIRQTTNELLIQKRMTAELQNKILNLQSQVSFLESNFFNYHESVSPQAHATPAVPPQRTQTRSFSPSAYSPPLEDNTMRLIQISKPK